MNNLLLVLAFVSGQASAEQSRPWVPFTGTWVETTRDHSGKTTQTVKTIETRSSDGTLLVVHSRDGQPIGGKLWQSCGRMFALDFSKKHAVYEKESPRVHLKVPPVVPLGSRTVAGVQCTVFPLIPRNGISGNICIDVANDIMLRQEIHMDHNGEKTELVKEIASIDFKSPLGNSTVAPPEGFQILVPAGKPEGCSAATSN